jgi:putative membrane fusion protein
MSILYLVIIQALHLVMLKMIDTGPLGRGELKKLYAAEGIAIRDETVIASPADGELVMLVEEGTRVRAGDSLAEIKTAGADPGMPALTALVRAPRTGVVSSRVDGLEGMLKPGQTDIVDAGRLWETASRLPDGGAARKVKCVKGQPVLKIIDNLSPMVMCLRVNGELPPEVLKKGGSVAMVREDREISGRIVEAGGYDGGMQLVVESSNYPADFVNIRKVDLQLVGERVSGFIVDTAALVDRDGLQGLFLLDRDEVKWTPVSVVGTVGEKSAIDGKGLEPGARYVMNPRWLKFAGN